MNEALHEALAKTKMAISQYIQLKSLNINITCKMFVQNFFLQEKINLQKKKRDNFLRLHANGKNKQISVCSYACSVYEIKQTDK